MNDVENTDITAFKAIYEALASLEEEARERVFMSVGAMLGINGSALSSKSPMAGQILKDGSIDGENFSEYSTFAELYAGVDPASNSEKALVAGYWLQVCQGAEGFSGSATNDELANLGHKLSNVTRAFSALIKAKPQLVLQVKKKGKSPQARKVYKLSQAGIDRIQEMIGG